MFLMLFNITQAAPFRAVISNVMATQTANGIGLKFKLNSHVDYQGFLLNNPSRFVIDIKNTQLNAPLDQSGMHHTHLRSINSAYHKNNLRLVFEFKDRYTTS